MSTELAATWLLTLAIHVGALTLAACVFDRVRFRARLAWREWMWCVALCGGLLSSTAQVALEAPGFARIFVAGDVRESATRVAGAGGIRSALAAQSREVRNGTGPALGSIEAPTGSTGSSAAGARLDVPGETGARPSPWLPSWHVFIVAAWLAGCLIGLRRLAGAWLRLQGALKRARPIVQGRLPADAAELSSLAGLDCPRLTQLDELASPIAAGGSRIVVPAWVFEQFDAAQMRAMLAHEMAHLARRDPYRRLAVAIVCTVLWFIPLASIARRRLDEIAEQSCDAWAANLLGDNRAMAECLAGCAERRLLGNELALATNMAGRDSPLLRRIDQLLDGRTMNTTISAPGAIAASAAVLFAAVLLLPGVGIRSVNADADRPSAPAAPTAAAPLKPPALPASRGGTHLRVSSETDASGRNRQSTLVETDDGNRAYRAKLDGLITYNANYDGIASLGKDSSASFAETSDGISRRVEYANRSGKLERHYFVADVEQPIDRAAEAWIATIIPELIRETAVDAAKRVRQIHAAHGTAAVLDEIGRIRSDYARGEYIEKLASLVGFTPAETTRVLGLVESFESDYERRKALTAIGTAGRFDAEQQVTVIGQARKIESDYERAELLLSLLPNLADNGAVRQAWLDATHGIDSDYEHRRCLSALVKAGGNDDAILATVIEAARTIESDYERRELLSTTMEAVTDAENIADAYAAAVDDMGGDYERREALLALIHARGFGAKATRAVLASLGGFGSDHESREVLVVLAHAMPGDPGLIERYREVAGRLSDFERAEAERALDRIAL